MRTLVRELPGLVDQRVTVKGWLHKMRKLGGLNFINLRDRSGVVQILIESEAEADKLKNLHIGTVLSIEGKIFKDDPLKS
jgi:nondiscriminating aspartyl-tRNA synthetase